ncbi:hypothetical protein EYC08_19190 [Tabrizicola sp. WMC-M-20]|nr:hypothetical protein EYC08_19190 [Tabrizicola sp. WMC-M-20]
MRFPAAVPERLGLALLQAAEINSEGLAALLARLTYHPAPNVDDEQVRLLAFVEGKDAVPAAPAKRTSIVSPNVDRRELVLGFWLARKGGGGSSCRVRCLMTPCKTGLKWH